MNTIKTEDKIEIKPGYKKTPIGIIPEDWEVKRLGDICDLKSGGTPSRKEDKYWNGTIPWITTSLVDFNKINKAEEFITAEGLENSSANVFPKGTTIMAIYGQGVTRGKVARLGIDASTNQACVAFLNDNMNLQTYLFYALSYRYLKLRHLSNDGSQKNLSSSILREYKLPIPPLPEQTAIADCLSTWDKGIEKLSALITAKKEQKKGLMQGIFSGQLKVENGELVKAKEGEDFTEGWETKRLNVIGKVNYGTRIVKGNVEEGEYFVYGGGGKTFTNKEYNREDRMIIARFAMSKECARFVKGKFYLNDSGLTVDANEKTNQSFLDYLLFFNQHNIYKLRAGGAQQNLDVQAFRRISLSIPSINEQTAIAEVLTTADKEIELLEKKLESYRTQKKGLMQVLLTGEKRLIDNE